MTDRPMFNNQPIALGNDTNGNGSYLDWSSPITTIMNETRNLNEGLLHRDPNQVRKALFILDQNYSFLKAYLSHPDVGVIAPAVVEAPATEAIKVDVPGDPWPFPKSPVKLHHKVKNFLTKTFNGDIV